MIKPFISPKELKARVDAGQNWVPIRKAEWPFFIMITNDDEYEQSGYEDIQNVGWLQNEELSPLELGIDMGVVLVPCIGHTEDIPTEAEGQTKTIMRYDPCSALTTWYGLIEDHCDRSTVCAKSDEEESDEEAETSPA